eukprot:9468131-Pyramimonas_sp.AAC.2
MESNNVNWSKNPSEYEKRYGDSDRRHHLRNNKIPCKYPERGPMLYEVLEYYGDLTSAMNDQHKHQRSTTTANDEFIFPREIRGYVKVPLANHRTSPPLVDVYRSLTTQGKFS